LAGESADAGAVKPEPKDSERLIPALPKPSDGGRRSSDISKRYPGGVRIRCKDGNVVFTVTDGGPAHAAAGDSVQLTTIAADRRIEVFGLAEDGNLVDSMAGDRLDASVRDTAPNAKETAHEFERVSHFALAGNVEVRGEDSLLTGDRLVYDPVSGVFRLEGKDVGLGLQDRAKLEGVEGITVVPATSSIVTGTAPSGTAQTGPKLRAVGRKMVIRLSSDQDRKEASDPKPATNKAQE
jgi:hypothetical protein